MNKPEETDDETLSFSPTEAVITIGGKPVPLIPTFNRAAFPIAGHAAFLKQRLYSGLEAGGLMELTPDPVLLEELKAFRFTDVKPPTDEQVIQFRRVVQGYHISEEDRALITALLDELNALVSPAGRECRVYDPATPEPEPFVPRALLPAPPPGRFPPEYPGLNVRPDGSGYMDGRPFMGTGRLAGMVMHGPTIELSPLAVERMKRYKKGGC